MVFAVVILLVWSLLWRVVVERVEVVVKVRVVVHV